MFKIEHKFICSRCDELHDDESDAMECCAPAVYEVYLCPICEETHDTEKDAGLCCGFTEEEEEAAAPEMRFPSHAVANKGTEEYVIEFNRINQLKD